MTFIFQLCFILVFCIVIKMGLYFISDRLQASQVTRMAPPVVPQQVLPSPSRMAFPMFAPQFRPAPQTHVRNKPRSECRDGIRIIVH